MLVHRREKIDYLRLTDFVAPLVPLGIATGRLGNFVNGELYGRATDLPWGMAFRSLGAGAVARHASQLYQFALEGLALLPCCGGSHRGHGRAARSRRCSSSATGYFALSPNTGASPTLIWACSPRTSRWGSRRR